MATAAVCDGTVTTLWERVPLQMRMMARSPEAFAKFRDAVLHRFGKETELVSDGVERHEARRVYSGVIRADGGRGPARAGRRSTASWRC